MQSLSFDDLNPGDRSTSPRRTVTETDIVMFAGMTGDYNPLHVDHDFAAQTPFRKPIAHGLLGLSWVAGLQSNSPRVDTVAFLGIRNWDFLQPIFAGDTVWVECEVLSREETGRKSGKVIWRHRLMKLPEVVCQQGEFVTLVRIDRQKRSAAAASASSETPTSHS